MTDAARTRLDVQAQLAAGAGLLTKLDASVRARGQTSVGDSAEYRTAVADAAAAAAVAAGFGHVDRALSLIEARTATESQLFVNSPAPNHYVPSLLPLGSLSYIGGPWQSYQKAPSAKAPPLARPQPSVPRACARRANRP